MGRTRRIPLVAAAFCCALVTRSLGASQQVPPRDRPAQSDSLSASGEISGRVLTADTGKPVKRARVSVSAPELTGARTVLTDERGAYQITALPAGRYTVRVSKNGFVTLFYGQRRPLVPGAPLQLSEGQRLRGVDFRLPHGSAVAGRIYDEEGDPLPGAFVRVMRYQYLQGERQLSVAGTDQTDDKGQYRVWGLMPGEYYVSAIARGAVAVPGGGVDDSDSRPFGQTEPEESQQTYAPTYYPGAGSINEARSITLAIGQESLDVDFSAQLVRTTRISGRAVYSNGVPASNGAVNLTTDLGSSSGRGAIGISCSGRIAGDGAFQIVNVPPGRYMLRARSDGFGTSHYASEPLSVAGGELSNLSVVLSPPAIIAGSIAFDGVQPGDIPQIRLSAPATDGANFGPEPAARVDRAGNFTITVPPGPRWIRLFTGDRAWVLKSVMIDGRETIDTGFEVRGGDTTSNAKVIVTNKAATINGTVTDDRGTPVSDFIVLAFPTDASLWRPQARHIATARPDQNGQFQIRGLPPGEYYLVIVDPGEQGEWFDPAFLDAHRRSALRVSLGDGEIKTQDLRIKTP